MHLVFKDGLTPCFAKDIIAILLVIKSRPGNCCAIEGQVAPMSTQSVHPVEWLQAPVSKGYAAVRH